MKNENLYRLYLKARNVIAYAHQNNLFQQTASISDFGPHAEEVADIVIKIDSAARKDGVEMNLWCFSRTINNKVPCSGWSCATCELKALADMFQKYEVYYV